MAKRFVTVIFIIMLALCCGILSGCKEKEQTDDTEGFSFALQGDEYAVTGYQGKTEITVPAAYNGKKVTSIAESAFVNSNVSKVIISEGIKTIGSNAFAAARGLYYIYIPASVTTIGDNIFSECSALNEIEVSKDNTVFSSLDGNLYDKAQKRLLAFSMGGGARDYALPEGVEEIRDYVFYKCYSINNLSLPSTLKKIGELAFVGSTILSFEVAETNSVFSALAGILYQDDGQTLYAYPSGKEGDTFETTAKKIYADAFAYSQIKTLTLSEGVQEVGDRAFMNSALEEIFIGDTITKIGDSPFQNCIYLTQITVSPTNANYQDIDGNLYNKSGDTFIAYAAAKDSQYFSLSEGIIEIAEFAFYGAHNLVEISLPSTLNKIGEEAFGSYKITTIVLHSPQPPSIKSTSFMQLSELTLYVPDNKSQQYKDAWKDFENSIKEFHER